MKEERKERRKIDLKGNEKKEGRKKKSESVG